MSGHAPILGCKLCASALARRQQAALTRNLQRCLSTSPVVARLAPKPSSSSTIAGRRSRPLRNGTPPPYASPSRRFPGKAPAPSVFKLSSDLRVQAGEGARDHDVLRQLQARTAELSVADPASQMLQILSALARRLGLDGIELKKLAKDWADTHPFESQKLLDPKGKGKQDARQSVDIDAVQKDLRVHGPRAIERTVLSCLVSWIREAAAEGKYVLSSQLDAILETLDVRFPPEQFPRARSKARKLILHVGPTNSGKTYNALCALAKAPRGVFAGPLRLLATEVYNRFNAGLIGGLTPANPRVCNLITGEERRIKDKFGGLDSCTIETMDLINSYDVVVIDEIQMIADPNRGSAWTNALLGAQAKEVHLCGEASVVDLVKRIGKACGDEVIVNRYERLSPLQIAKSSLAGDLRKLRPGDCVVTFSRNNIFALKTEIEKTTGLKVAVAYGSLPPEVREEQAKGFNAAGTQGGYDVMVASDAIGMGLNLKIKRVIFETLSKYDGQQAVDLSHSQIKQIAGRAGRYGTNTTTSSPSAPDTDNVDSVKEQEAQESAGGIVTCLDPEDMPLLRKALAAPMEPIEKATLRARPSELEAFSSLLPETTTQSHVFEIFPVLASMGPDYYSPAFGAGLKVSNLVSDIPNLLLADRWEMVQAPVNLRDPKVAALYTKWVGAYANQQIVRLTDWFSDDGAEYSQMLAEFRKVDDRNTDVKLAAGLNNELAIKFASPANLAGLESLHRCIGLYHWLSSRFSLLFPQAAEARLLKIETEDAIDFILRQMTFVRKRYLSSSRKNAPFFQHSGRLDERAML